MRYSYPIQAEVPRGHEIASIGYLVFWKREDADQMMPEILRGEIDLDQAYGTEFEADVRGYWTSSYGGLQNKKGRASTIVVVAHTTTGQQLFGVTGIPDEEAAITITLEPRP